MLRGLFDQFKMLVEIVIGGGVGLLRALLLVEVAPRGTARRKRRKQSTLWSPDGGLPFVRQLECVLALEQIYHHVATRKSREANICGDKRTRLGAWPSPHRQNVRGVPIETPSKRHHRGAVGRLVKNGTLA